MPEISCPVVGLSGQKNRPICSNAWRSGRTALVVAPVTNGIDAKRPRVISVVVAGSWFAAVNASESAGRSYRLSPSGASHQHADDPLVAAVRISGGSTRKVGAPTCNAACLGSRASLRASAAADNTNARVSNPTHYALFS